VFGRIDARDTADTGAGNRLQFITRLGRTEPHLRGAGFAIAVAGTAVLTLALLPFRNDLTPLSKGFGYLCVVVAAAAIGGLGPGILASFLGFFSFNYFFLPPYGTFTIGRPEFAVVLFVFLGLSVVISELLARATERAHSAELREAELKTIQALSRELTLRVPGPETYEAALKQLCDVFGFSAATLFIESTGETQGLTAHVTVGDTAEPLEASWDPRRDDQPPERLPLSVGGRLLGMVVLKGDRPPVSPAENRVLRSFCDQVALVLERDRLLKTATEAEIYRQTEASRRALLAAVSHDLRSPLAAIKASATDLLDEEGGTREQDRREALLAIDAETDRLNDLIANLLDISRIEGGMLRAKVETVDVAEIVAECADRAGRQQPELHIAVRIPENAEFVKADAVFLDRVVTNLLDNAAKAAIAAGAPEILIESKRAPDAVTLRVIDHGRGLPRATREQLFYPFYHLDERNPRLGSGLGLAICKGFVTLMGGDIWVEDTPGGGATFAITLPMVPVPSTP
jgi:two-component system, OmpR family, sensor histidine kinase KdpD